MDFEMPLPPPQFLPTPKFPRRPGHPGPCYFLLLGATAHSMDLWVQLKQAGLEPPGLGPPPRALWEPPLEDIPGQPLMSMSPGAGPGGAQQSLLWIWEELGNLRRVDVQLLGQFCSLGLEMGALREELVAILEEEEEEEMAEEKEEDEEPQRMQEEGHLGASCPALRPPDFEMTI